MRAHTKQDQTYGGDDGDAGHIENTLEDINAESVGDGQVLFFCQQQGPDGLAGPAQQKNGGEPGQRELINLPKICVADVALEDLPA